MFNESVNFTQNDIVIGFDLGTTNSVLSYYNAEIPEVIMLDKRSIVPSFVEFNQDKTVKCVGLPAQRNRTSPLTVSSFKKFMGTDKKLIWDFTAEDISTMFVEHVFYKLKEQHPHLSSANSVVVSVPAYFNINQINATKQAFRRNNIKVIDVNIEPVSAALVYKEMKRITEPIMVFDLGGGTFDAVLLSNTSGIPPESLDLYKKAGVTFPEDSSKLSVVDITGDNRLGGDDIDEYAISLYKEQTRSTKSDKELLHIAETVKHTKKSVDDFLFEYVETATTKVMMRCMSLVTQLLNRNNIQKVHCVLCGGSTKSTIIKSTLRKQFKISTEIDPDLSVSIGNSLYAGKSLIIQRTPKHIGIMVSGKFKCVVQKGTILPVAKAVYVTNKVPYDEVVDLKFYQANSILSEPEHISTVEVTNLDGYDEDGFVAIGIYLECLLDGSINAKIDSGSTTRQISLTYVDSVQQKPDHPLVAMIRKTNATLQDKIITELLEMWDKTNEATYLGEMNKRLIECRNK